jgi:hypothetical protein
MNPLLRVHCCSEPRSHFYPMALPVSRSWFLEAETWESDGIQVEDFAW